MDADYFEKNREEESIKYAEWSGSTRNDKPVAVPDSQGAAAKIVADVRSGILSGASKTIIDSGDKTAVELAKKQLTEEELKRVQFVER